MERSDLSITLFCDSDEADTRVNSDQRRGVSSKGQGRPEGCQSAGRSVHGGGSGRSTV